LTHRDAALEKNVGFAPFLMDFNCQISASPPIRHAPRCLKSLALTCSILVTCMICGNCQQILHTNDTWSFIGHTHFSKENNTQA
jgi:hypothetical protein